MDLEVLQRALERERKRCAQAELLLEEKSRELYRSYRQLEDAHEELKANKDQLVQSEKMASLGVMAAGVAHEINNPVGFVSSNLNTLTDYVASFAKVVAVVEKYPKGPSVEQWNAIGELYRAEDIGFLVTDAITLLQECEGGLERVRAIVAGLKAYAHAGQGKFERIDVLACLQATLPIVLAQRASPCRIEERYEALPMIQGNSGRLGQVFLNLLANATDAVEGSDDGCVAVQTSVIDDAIEVRIVDNGCGIAPEHQQRLFEPFFTTKPMGKGTGLGLPISLGIVQEHGGAIDCSSQPGETIFRVTLPLEG